MIWMRCNDAVINMICCNRDRELNSFCRRWPSFIAIIRFDFINVTKTRRCQSAMIMGTYCPRCLPRNPLHLMSFDFQVFVWFLGMHSFTYGVPILSSLSSCIATYLWGVWIYNIEIPLVIQRLCCSFQRYHVIHFLSFIRNENHHYIKP